MGKQKEKKRNTKQKNEQIEKKNKTKKKEKTKKEEACGVGKATVLSPHLLKY